MYSHSVYNQLQSRGHISPYILILTEDFEPPVIEIAKVEVDNVLFYSESKSQQFDRKLHLL